MQAEKNRLESIILEGIKGSVYKQKSLVKEFVVTSSISKYLKYFVKIFQFPTKEKNVQFLETIETRIFISEGQVVEFSINNLALDFIYD